MKTCGICGKKFEPKNPKTQYCTQRKKWWCWDCHQAAVIISTEGTLLEKMLLHLIVDVAAKSEKVEK